MTAGTRVTRLRKRLLIFSQPTISSLSLFCTSTHPEVSFAVRELGAQCGVVLTASHNPPEYNGYKVYWEDGGQIVPPHDNGIIEEINAIDFSDIQFAVKAENITLIDKNIDEDFQNACVANGLLGDGDRSQLKVVLHHYTDISRPFLQFCKKLVITSPHR